MSTIVKHKFIKPYRVVIDHSGNYILERKQKGIRQATNKEAGYKKGDKYIVWKNIGYYTTREGAFFKVCTIKAELKYDGEEVDAEVLLAAYKKA